MKDGNIQNAAMSGAKWLMVSNIFQKLFTFGINQVIIRQSSPEIFGIAAVQLELLLSTLLFISREGIRLALLRSVSSDKESKQKFINLSWAPPLVVASFTVALYCYCPSFIGGMNREVVLLYCLGAFFESVGEPWFNSYNRVFQLTPRVKADAFAVTARSVLTYITVVHLDMGVVGFGVAQLSYGLTHCITLISHHKSVFGDISKIADFFPTLSKSTTAYKSHGGLTSAFALVDRAVGLDQTKEALFMSGTSVLKHFLTEADKIALSVTASNYDQGVYAVTHNYGSLVVRLFFQPLEETSRIAYARMSATASSASSSDKEDPKQEMATMLQGTLRIVVLCGTLFPLFGPAYARVAVRVALGQKWYSEDTVAAISAFCFYIFVMGLNGVTEAFMQAVATAGFLNPVNISLLLSSGAFLLSAPSLIKYYGTTGIIVANSLSMVVRITCSIFFIVKYLDTPGGESISKQVPRRHSRILRTVIPGPVDVLCMAVVVGATTYSSNLYASSTMQLVHAGQHVLVGGMCLIFLVGVTWKLHRKELVAIAKSVLTSKKEEKEKEN